jgi:hypothetical protein
MGAKPSKDMAGKPVVVVVGGGYAGVSCAKVSLIVCVCYFFVVGKGSGDFCCELIV